MKKTNNLFQLETVGIGIFFLIFIMLVVFTYFVTFPMFTKLMEAKNFISEQDSRYKKLQAKVKELEGLNEFELADRNTLSIKSIPNEKDFLGPIINLSSMSAENGLLIESLNITPGDISATASAKLIDKKLEALDFNLQLYGPLDSLKSFFRSLERSLPLFTISKLDLQFEGNASLKSSTYYLALPELLGKYEDPVEKLSSEEIRTLDKINTYTQTTPVTFTPGNGGKINPFFE